MLTVDYQLVNGGKLPKKANETDAGWDLFANSDKTGVFPVIAGALCVCPAECDKCHPVIGLVYARNKQQFACGFKMALPVGWEADVRTRSGMAFKRSTFVINSPGTVDAGFRDEVQVMLYNLSDIALEVRRGDKIAQMLFLPVPDVSWNQVSEFKGLDRGGGIGSSGR